MTISALLTSVRAYIGLFYVRVQCKWVGGGKGCGGGGQGLPEVLYSPLSRPKLACCKNPVEGWGTRSAILTFVQT